jgi:hypothetical protein
MHGALAAAYEADTIVADDPDAVGDVMHVQLLYGDNARHRLMPNQQHLSCKLYPLDHGNVIILPEKLDGDGYCEICFTQAERDEALSAVVKRRNDADSFVGIKPRRK